MIDEELYQQAADELNSDRRRAHIWARACALASDDHDEARYLYTNLRVEELIAERESGLDTVSTTIDTDDHDATLALELVDTSLEAEDLFPFGDHSADFSLNADNESHSPISSSRAGIDDDDTSDKLELLPTGLDDSTGEQSKFATRKTFEEQPEIHIVRPVSHSINAEAEPESPMERDYHTQQEAARQWDGTTANETSSTDMFAQSSENFHNESLDETTDLDGTAVIDFDPEELEELRASLSDGDDENAPENDLDETEAEEGFDRSSVEATQEDIETDALTQNNEQLSELLDGVFEATAVDQEQELIEAELVDDAEGGVLTADFSDASGTQSVITDEELDWLDGDTPEEASKNQLDTYTFPDSQKQDDIDLLSQELERQADELPGQRSDIVADETSLDIANDDFQYETEQQPRGNFQATGSRTYSDAPEMEDYDTEAVVAGTAAAAAFSATATDREPEQDQFQPLFPLDLTDGQSGPVYEIYKRDSQIQAVKQGASWSALFLTIPYLVYRHLFGTAFAYTIMTTIVLAGLLLTGLSWLDAGQTASPLIKAGTGGFALLAVAGLLYLPFRYGNTWRSEKLEGRGFELIAETRASNPGKAIAKTRRAAPLD